MAGDNLIERVAAFNAVNRAAKISHAGENPKAVTGGKHAKESFESVLQDQLGLKFSAHAQQRIDQRQVTLEPSELARLQKAVRSAEMKGSRDALVLLNNKAFIVSVVNNTVITALNGNEGAEKVFTNIDSAVVA